MAKSKQALPLRSKVNAAMKAAYVALYAQLGRQRPAWGTETSAPLDAWTTAQVLDLEMPDSLGLIEQRAGGMAWLESRQNANGSWTGQLFRKANGDVPATAHALLAMHDFGDGFTASTLSGYDWLVHTCDRGWMAAPVVTPTGGRGEPALRHGVRDPGPAPRSPQHRDVDRRPRGARGPAGEPHARRRLGLQQARTLGRHVHLLRAARLRRGAGAVGDLVRRPRPRARHGLARRTTAGERLLAGLAGHRAQPGGDGVRPHGARRGSTASTRPPDVRACSPCSPSSTTGSGPWTTAAAAPG